MQINEPQPDVIETAEQIWELPLQPAGCSHCGQAHLVEKEKIGSPCPNCAQSLLQPQPARLRSERPERLLPFQVKQTGLSGMLTEFVKGVWLHPDDFNPQTLLQRAVPVFAPMWLVDSDVLGSWQAEVGFDYQVKSSQEYYSSGGWQTREKLEERVRWEPRLGQVDLHYDNAPVPALSSHKHLVDQAGDYTLKAAVPFEPALLGGAAVRVPDLQTAQAWPLARDILERRIAHDCQQASGAQHFRRFTSNLVYDNQNWTQLLLPLYFTWYSDDEGNRQVVYINGQSGRAGGMRLASQRKGWKWAGITAAVAVGIFLLALLCFALGALFPPAAVFGTVLAILALLTATGAIVPAVWPWQWNRKQMEMKVSEKGD